MAGLRQEHEGGPKENTQTADRYRAGQEGRILT
jgi:hypothetical protein